MTKSNPTDPREKYWDMYQILGGYFHQDYDSFDQGLAEFLQNNVQSKEKSLIKIRGFLASDKLSDAEKIQIIKQFVELNFEYFNLEPLSWLEDFARKIEENQQAEKK